MNTGDEKLACWYARASTDDQAGSVPAQRESLQTLADREGFEVIERFEDDGVSGTTGRRSAFQRMLEQARKGARWRYILVWDRKRFFRPEDAREAVGVVYELERLGKTIVPVHGAARTGEVVVDAIMDLLEFGQAGKESIDKSRDVLRGQRASACKGTIPNGRIPYGYDALYIESSGQPRRRVRYLPDRSKEIRTPDGQRLLEVWPPSRKVRKAGDESLVMVPGDPAKVAVVCRVFAEYAAGDSGRTIAHRLNTEGVPSPLGVGWRRNMILRMVSNPAYKGTLAWNRQTWARFHRARGDGQIERISNPQKHWQALPETEWVLWEGRWPGLVDSETWEAAFKRFKAAKPAPNELKGRGHGSVYLASGLLRCACGSPYVGSEGYYRCSGRNDKGVSFCTAGRIKREVVDDYLERRIRELFFAPSAQAVVISEIAAQIDVVVANEHDGEPAASEQLADIKAQLDRLVEKVAAGVLEDDEARPHLDRLRKKKQELEQLAQRPQPQTLAKMRDKILTACQEKLRVQADLWPGAAPIQRKKIVRGFVEGLRVDHAAKVIEATFLPLAVTPDSVVQATTC